MTVQKEQVIAKLKEVVDPEVNLNIWDFGLVYEVNISAENEVSIVMTLTVPGCPLYSVITEEVNTKVASIEGVTKVDLQMVFEPRWTPAKITDDGKAQLREMGYNI